MWLLCLDNAEEIIENDNREFLTFLSELFDHCPAVNMIVTSIKDIGRLPNQINPKPFFLRQLRSHSAVELFLQQAPFVDNEKMIEFLQADETFPIKKFLPSLKDIDEPVSIKDLSPAQLKELDIRL